MPLRSITRYIVAALTLNITAVLFSLGLSIAMPASRASSIYEELAKEGYSVPLDAIYSNVQAGEFVTGCFVSAPIIVSSATLIYCIWKLKDMPE